MDFKRLDTYDKNIEHGNRGLTGNNVSLLFYT